MPTSQMTIERDDVATVCDLLNNVGQAHGASSDTREAAVYWASQVDGSMERRDLQTIAWLLRDIADERGIPASYRDDARYWAAYLEGRTAR